MFKPLKETLTAHIIPLICLPCTSISLARFSSLHRQITAFIETVSLPQLARSNFVWFYRLSCHFKSRCNSQSKNFTANETKWQQNTKGKAIEKTEEEGNASSEQEGNFMAENKSLHSVCDIHLIEL